MASREHQLLRRRDGGHARVGFAELFFDLVFVFAVTQLSHSLLAHPDLPGALHVAMLFLAMWWSWIYTAWATNWLDPETAEIRLLLFALMAAALLAAIAIPRAFEDRGLLFALAFSGAQVGRALTVAFIMRRADPGNSRNFARIAIWGAAAGTFWVLGALASPETRPALWGVALLVEYAAPAAGFRVPGLGASRTSDWSVGGGHMAERCGLFVIIALGESILITGATFAQAPWDPAVLGAFATAFAGAVAMWWCYFNVGAERGSHVIAQTDDPGRVARLAYTYLHLPIVAGIILSAAGNEFVLAHPGGRAEPVAAMALIGGPALYLFGLLLFKHVTAGWPPLSHVAGLALFAVLALFANALPPVLIAAFASAILVLVAGWETRGVRGR